MRQAQRVAGQQFQVIRLLLDAPELFVQFFGLAPGQLDRDPNPRQRAAQLMGDVAEQFRTRGNQLFKPLCHAVELPAEFAHFIVASASPDLHARGQIAGGELACSRHDPTQRIGEGSAQDKADQRTDDERGDDYRPAHQRSTQCAQDWGRIRSQHGQVLHTVAGNQLSRPIAGKAGLRIGARERRFHRWRNIALQNFLARRIEHEQRKVRRKVGRIAQPPAKAIFTAVLEHHVGTPDQLVITQLTLFIPGVDHGVGAVGHHRQQQEHRGPERKEDSPEQSNHGEAGSQSDNSRYPAPRTFRMGESPLASFPILVRRWEIWVSMARS